MKYIVYLTKNKIDGRIFIGVHGTEDVEIFDGYIGNGVWANQPSSLMYPKTPFQYACKKYGIESFDRTTLYVYGNEKDAIKKMRELVDTRFVLADNNYNMFDAYLDRPIYQYDFKGNLKKIWNSGIELTDFYQYPLTRFKTAIKLKYSFLDSYWSFNDSINTSEYINKYLPKVLFLISKQGKLIKEFSSPDECKSYFNLEYDDYLRCLNHQVLLDNKYYISDKMVDIFRTKPRRQYLKTQFYVYKDGELYAEPFGKELMNTIWLHSWDRISRIFSHHDGWYKDYYISLQPISKVPEKKEKIITVDVYDKYGNYIESLNDLKDIKTKYSLTNKNIKDIQLGRNKFYGNYIFKYTSK